MKIATSVPVFKQPSDSIPTIANFWNEISEGWKEIWGPHIHHGYYQDDEMLTSLKAQEKLIEMLANLLLLKPKQKILDVGCGIGGTALFLAEQYQTEVVGITLSQRQLDIANNTLNIFHNDNTKPTLAVTFKLDDAHQLSAFSDQSVDIVWSLESCEQFYDKQKFLKHAHRVLKPGGQLMLATWCSDQEYYVGSSAKQYLKICKTFDLPYMPTINYYRQTLVPFFEIQTVLDWTQYVKKSWDMGLTALSQYSFMTLLKMGGLLGIRFAYRMKFLKEGFHTGKIRYGIFICKKPEEQKEPQ